MLIGNSLRAVNINLGREPERVQCAVFDKSRAAYISEKDLEINNYHGTEEEKECGRKRMCHSVRYHRMIRIACVGSLFGYARIVILVSRHMARA